MYQPVYVVVHLQRDDAKENRVVCRDESRGCNSVRCPLRGFHMAWNYIGPTGLTGCDFLMVVLIFEALQDFKGRVMEKLVI